jgi:hypothetical protein
MINNSKRILDYNNQLVRIFERFFITYDTIEEANGIYDVIVVHREGISDNFEDIQNYIHNNTIFIVDITTESGNLQIFLDSFKKLTDSSNYKFYLFVDSDLSEYVKSTDINYEIIYGHELLYYAHTNMQSDCVIQFKRNKNIPFTNSYLSFNGSLRPQRILFLLELLKNNIQIDNAGFLFYMKTNSGYEFLRHEYEGMVRNLKNDKIIIDSDVEILLKADVPKELDYSVGIETNVFNSIDNSYSYPINFVTENVTGLVNGDESPYGLITFSEKSIKPFIAHQIPLIFGVFGIQQRLRDLGFDLFDDYVNHNSYENIKDPYRRLQKMVLELKRLLEFDNIKFLNDNKNRFINNHLKVYELGNRGFDILNDFYKKTIL